MKGAKTRHFGLALLGLAVCALLVAVLSHLATPDHHVAAADLWSEETEVLFACGFEEGDDVPVSLESGVTQEIASEGEASLECGTSEGRTVATFPVDLPANRRIHVSLSAKASVPGTCSLFEELPGGVRKPIGEGPIGADWSRIEGSFFTDESPVLQRMISAEVSEPQKGQKLWIDDIEVTAITIATTGSSSDWTEAMPAVAADSRGAVWLAVVARSLESREIRLYRETDGERNLVFRFRDEDATALGSPALAVGPSACFLAFPVERGGRWRLSYAFLDAEEPAEGPRVQEVPEVEGIVPAAAWVNGQVCLVWQSVGEERHGVHQAWLTETSCSGAVLLSAAGANSRNPSVCALPDGSVFAAWDSVRGKTRGLNSDLYGTWYRDGRWRGEVRLTSDPRIEQNPRLATDGAHVWLAWEAWSFTDHRIHQGTEQRIVAARLDGATLEAPAQLFSRVSDGSAFQRAPALALDDTGNLWLSYREFAHGGWDAMVSRYAGDTWERPRLLTSNQSFSEVIPLAPLQEGCVAAVCCTAIARRRIPYKLEGPRASTVKTVVLDGSTAEAPLQVESLVMPDTEFTLDLRLSRSTPSLPRQEQFFDGRRLSLYWGDLHEHTELSVCLRAVNPPLDGYLALQRDVEFLDFTTVTDHAFSHDPLSWSFTASRLRALCCPGSFLTFPGQEWTGDMKGRVAGEEAGPFGHRNILFLDPCASDFYVPTEASCNPRDLWEQLDPQSAIVIPHQLADIQLSPVLWEYTDETMEPLAEIWQVRGSYECVGCPRQARWTGKEPGHFLRDAWERGVVTGVTAGPDHGGGYGKTGVWAEDLTRESIFRALRARRTVATTDAKIALYFGVGTAHLGEKVTEPPPHPAPIEVKAETLGDISEVAIFRNNEVVHKRTDCGPSVEFEWVDHSNDEGGRTWYDVRVIRADGEMAWASPVWFVPEEE